jgi:ferritin
MHNEKLVSAVLNTQINAEFYSAYLYLAMSAYFEATNLSGFAHWMQVQAQEELTHALKFCNFMHDKLWRVNLTEIAKPQFEWQSPTAAIADALAHEKKITAAINNLVDLAIESKEHSVHSFLNWFVDEQVEEEANADKILNQLHLIANNTSALLVLDHNLSTR